MGTETRGRYKDINTREIINRREDRSNREVTSQLVDLGRLVVDLELGLSKSSEAGGVGFEELLEDLAFFFKNDLRRKTGGTLETQQPKEDPNRLQAIGPNLGDYT